MRRLALLALLLPACSSGGDGLPAPDTVGVTAKDCRLTEPTLHAGRTVFQVTNDAAVPATVALVVDGDQVVAEQRDVAPGAKATLDVDLSDGDYDLTCQAGGAPVRTRVHVEGGHEGHDEPTP